VLASGCTSPGSEEERGVHDRRNGSGFGLCLTVIQLDGLDFWCSNGFSLWCLGDVESSKD